MSVGAQLSRGQDADTGAPLDDVAPQSMSLIVRHTAARRLDSYLRVAAVDAPRRRRSERSADARLRADGRRSHLALDRPPATFVRIVRNLLDQRFYSSAGPRWVEAPGRHASITLAVGF